MIAEKGVDHATDFSEHGQLARFSMALAEMDKPGTVLDIGCAVADFYFYLKPRFRVQQYTGIDLNPTFVERAKERVAAEPNTAVFCEDITKVMLPGLFGLFTYVFASGVFCYAESLKQAYEILQKLWAVTDHKLIVNFLNKDVGKGLRWYSPEEIIMLQKPLSPAFELSARLPNDYLLILHRKFTHA